MIETSLQTDGFGRSILLDAAGNIIAGNGVTEAAGNVGLEDVIVVQSDGTKVIAVQRTDVQPGSERAVRLAIADNRAQELSDFDPAVVAALANEVDLSDFWRDDELDALLAGIETEAEAAGDDPGAQLDKAAQHQEKWSVVVGDLWECGNHRVLCGDATNADDVARLFGGERPAIMVTDPPYGVEYDPTWRNDAAEKGLIAFAARREGLVTNDDRIDWQEAWALFPGDVVYCWHADRHASSVQVNLENAGFEVRAQIIWAKPRFVISRGHYHWQHEPCWYAVKKGATASWVGDHSQTTLWEIPMNDDSFNSGHGTQKPVECMARPLNNHAGDVYDPFLGSGTTMVAAEQLGRRCYGMEIEPSYAACVLERMSGMGLTPRLVARDGGTTDQADG